VAWSQARSLVAGEMGAIEVEFARRLCQRAHARSIGSARGALGCLLATASLGLGADVLQAFSLELESLSPEGFLAWMRNEIELGPDPSCP